MDGDSLPVSAFVANANGEWEQGASAYEKRGTAVNVPEWDASKCVGCNQCAFVCSHATIRPFQLTADELAAAPAQTKSRDNKPANEYKFVMAVSPLDCMGCGECVTVCPTKAIQMVPQESQADQQAVFDYCVANISKKPSKFADDTVIGSQFNQPLLEFSGSCAGCAETSYARLITQLFGEKMYISNATGCSSIWGGTASISPYTVNKDSGHGPAWCNSLFEDNAEHGLGLYLGQKTVRENLIKRIAEVAGSDKASAELKAAFDKFMETKNNTKANDEPAKALIAELEKAAAAGCTESAEILKSKEFIAKKSVWIFGGDGWAYDIGFGGLDHVLASGEDVNVMVFDTEMAAPQKIQEPFWDPGFFAIYIKKLEIGGQADGECNFCRQWFEPLLSGLTFLGRYVGQPGGTARGDREKQRLLFHGIRAHRECCVKIPLLYGG